MSTSNSIKATKFGALLGGIAAAAALATAAHAQDTASVSDHQAAAGDAATAHSRAGASVTVVSPAELQRGLKAQRGQTCEELFAQKKPCYRVARPGLRIDAIAEGASQGAGAPAAPSNPTPSAVESAPPANDGRTVLNAVVLSIGQLGAKLGPHEAPPPQDNNYGCKVVWHGPFTSKCTDYTTEASGSYPITIGADVNTGDIKAVVTSGVVSFDYRASYHAGEGWLKTINGTIMAGAQVASVVFQGEQIGLLRQQINQSANFNQSIVTGIENGKFTNLFGNMSCGVVLNSQSTTANSNGTCVINSSVAGSAIGGGNSATNPGTTYNGNSRIFSPNGPGG